MHENKALFLFFCFSSYIYILSTFHKKSGILISDLYFYNIKIKPQDKYAKNHKSLLFFSLFSFGRARSLAEASDPAD
jgi:predicted adenine nucleotide alpha hydrolase (AANH) superfamily ATPase